MWMHITTALVSSSKVLMSGNEVICPPVGLCISKHHDATDLSFSTSASLSYTVFNMEATNLQSTGHMRLMFWAQA